MKRFGIFQDSDGNYSSKRLAFLLIVLVGLFIVCAMTFQDKDWLTITSVWASLMGTALMLVGLGKSGENKELKIREEQK